jgi:predicted DNA-binding transcriptional regulator AlpA
VENQASKSEFAMACPLMGRELSFSIAAKEMRKMPADSFVRKPGVLEMTGLCGTELYNLIRLGKFPKQYSLGARSVAWSRNEILAWIEATKARGQRPAAQGSEATQQPAA